MIRAGLGAAAAAALLLGACSHKQGETPPASVFAPLKPLVRSSVAQQALPGPNVAAIEITSRKQLRAPGIYAVRNGVIDAELCKNDIDQQIALINMPRDRYTTGDTIIDETIGENITVSVPGIGSLRKPYSKAKVVGFTRTQATTPDNTDAVDYVLANVAAECRNNILPKNVPYVVVTAEARADKAYTIRRGAVEANFTFWLVNAGVSNPEVVSGPISDVTFAISGREVP